MDLQVNPSLTLLTAYEGCQLKHSHASFPSERAEFHMSRLEVQSQPVPSHVTWLKSNTHNYSSQNHAITEHTSAKWQCESSSFQSGSVMQSASARCGFCDRSQFVYMLPGLTRVSRLAYGREVNRTTPRTYEPSPRQNVWTPRTR